MVTGWVPLKRSIRQGQYENYRCGRPIGGAAEVDSQQVTLDEIDGPNRATDLVVPGDSPEWRNFKRLIQDEDELWYFTSPPDFFFQCAGRMGYVIFRNRKRVENYVAIMN